MHNNKSTKNYSYINYKYFNNFKESHDLNQGRAKENLINNLISQKENDSSYIFEQENSVGTYEIKGDKKLFAKSIIQLYYNDLANSFNNFNVFKSFKNW